MQEGGDISWQRMKSTPGRRNAWDYINRTGRDEGEKDRKEDHWENPRVESERVEKRRRRRRER